LFNYFSLIQYYFLVEYCFLALEEFVRWDYGYRLISKGVEAKLNRDLRDYG